ncbi:elongation factor P 5-aminopentanone reductase [Youngiibacter multivorans]|uniref:3-oxoacyl-[acyl-carrier protein] reductase n=1 Tax=Youngiibacter multivorans TaxID=937251 RepID=A0ABS4G7W4_9CLOT|nr:SDR family oxidoreductase [Youngiibacter multivorans]MBP1920360.1 3-oxoacyl-[acyl-carrier protein] reductase [Youngiibacter multivorans]
MAKTALVTGASGGIGGAIAKRLSEMGYSLILMYGTNDAGITALKETLSGNPNVEVISCDFKDGAKMNSVSRLLSEKHKDVEVIIHAAGISKREIFHEMSTEDFENLISVNIKPLYYISRALIPMMIEKGTGDIISISSIWGSRAASLEVAYAMTKGALEQFTRGLAAELSHMGVRVNAIAPGGIDTEILSNLSVSEKDEFLSDIPFKRLGRPEEIADLVEFLLTKGRYMTGQVITIDGGYTL